MSFKNTLGRALGLVTVAAALASGTATAASHYTEQGLRADGLRWTAMANAYAESAASKHYTDQGLKADGLRLQGMAQRYMQRQNAPAADYYTPQALKAEGLRWQAMAEAYAQPRLSTTSRGGFHWGAAGVGAAGGFALALGLAILIAWARRARETKVAL